MKTTKILLFLCLLLWILTGCSSRIRNTERTDVKKVTTIDFKDKTQTITTKKADSLFKILGSSLIKSFTPRDYNPAFPGDTLETMETENAEMKIKTTVNKKTGKITTEGTAKPRDIHLTVDETIVENKDVSLDLQAKSDSSSKETEKIVTPPPGLSKIPELLEMVFVILIVVAGLYLGLRYMVKRSQSKNG